MRVYSGSKSEQHARRRRALGHEKDTSLALNPLSTRRAVAIVLATVALAASLSPGSAPASPSRSTDASVARKHAPAKKRLTAKKRRAIRLELSRQVRRNPAAVTRTSWVRSASLVNYKLPMTVRLSRPDGLGGYEPSDDELEITWDDGANPWPLTGGAPGVVQTAMLNGKFTMEASFGDDADGYGELGATETTVGGGVDMTATPFTISEFDPLCGNGPQLVIDPSSAVAISSAGRKYGVLNLFTGDVRGSLSLRMTSTTIATDGCGGATSTPLTVDNSSATPMPLRFMGKFAISPGITPDGKLRFGKLTIDDAVTPQLSTFALFRACSGVLTCDPLAFPSRLKLKKLTADVLLGSVALYQRPST